MKLLIIDIDGTLADDKWRSNVADFDERQMQAKHDKPIAVMVELVAATHKSWYKVALTSRNERWRSLTMRWLMDNGIMLHDVVMRPDDDFAPANEFKVKTVKVMCTEFKEPHITMLLMDSRNDVVQAYRMEGWVALCTQS